MESIFIERVLLLMLKVCKSIVFVALVFVLVGCGGKETVREISLEDYETPLPFGADALRLVGDDALIRSLLNDCYDDSSGD